MDKTFYLSIALNTASLFYLYFAYRKYKKAEKCLRESEKAEEETLQNLYKSQVHLERCKKLSAEMEAKGEMLRRSKKERENI